MIGQVVQQSSPRDPAVLESLDFFRKVFDDIPLKPFAIRLWDGSQWRHGSEPPLFTLDIKHPLALRSLFWRPTELSLGEAFVADDFDVQGDLENSFYLAAFLLERNWRMTDMLHLARKMFQSSTKIAPDLRRRKRDAQAIRDCVDISNDFFRLWLDERMVYSCALFHRPEEEGIDSAQYRKLDYLCRQLRLKPGEKFLDIGCAWGGLLIHAAEQYGVEALGVTPSRARAELANERIRKAGLAGRCRVEVCDYRDIPRQLSYDKLVGVGMFEPVGESQFPEYFRRAHQLLNPGGVFLYQGIIKPICRMPDNRRALIGKYAFPEGEPAPISVSLGAAEAAGFEIRDVENLREHHALTLRHWIRRLEARAEWAIALTNPSIYRVWRMYLAGLAHGFETGMLGLYQTRLVKSGIRSSGLPLAHCDWYRPCPRGHHA